jgi:hypothetical protein
MARYRSRPSEIEADQWFPGKTGRDIEIHHNGPNVGTPPPASFAHGDVVEFDPAAPGADATVTAMRLATVGDAPSVFAYEGSRDDLADEMVLLGARELTDTETLEEYAARSGLVVEDCGAYVLVGESMAVADAVALGEAWVRDNLIVPGGEGAPDGDGPTGGG